MADTVKGTEAFIRKRLGGRYSLERLKKIPDGSVHNIFKALSKKKGISIQEIYKKAGKQLDITKVHTQKSKPHELEGATADSERKEELEKKYAPFMVSKKVVGIKEFFFEPNIGFLFIPLNAEGNGVEIQTFAFKGYESDFEKIGGLLAPSNITQVRIESDFEKNPVAASDELYENIVDKLTFWGYRVKSIETRNIRGVLMALRENEKLKGAPSKVPMYTQYYIALLVSKKVSGGLIFSQEKKVCLLLAPRTVDLGRSGIDLIECEGSQQDILKIKMACKMSGQQGKINFMEWPATKNMKLLNDPAQ